MRKMGDIFKDGRVVGITVSAVLMAAVVGGVGTAVAVSNAEQGAVAVVVETVEPVDYTTLPYTNGLAGEQETDAAAAVAAEQARLAVEAEAARIAAEQAAAAEAERVAAEQAAAVQENEEPTYDEPDAPAGDAPSGCPPGYVDDPNRGCHSPICEVKADGTQVPCQF